MTNTARALPGAIVAAPIAVAAIPVQRGRRTMYSHRVVLVHRDGTERHLGPFEGPTWLDAFTAASAAGEAAQQPGESLCIDCRGDNTRAALEASDTQEA